MSREQISKGKIFPKNALETASASTDNLNIVGLSGKDYGVFNSKTPGSILKSHCSAQQQANGFSALTSNAFYEGQPNIKTNVVRLNFSLPEAYKLDSLKKANREMFDNLSPGSLKGMLEHIDWEAGAKIKLHHVANSIGNNLNKQLKIIVAIDKNSSVDWVFERLLKSPMLDKKLRDRVAMIDHAVDLEIRKSLLKRFRQQDDNSLVALIVQTDAVKNGLLDEAINQTQPYDGCYKIIFFDTLRNYPAAVLEFAMLFQLPQQCDPTKVEFLKTDEPDLNVHTPFNA